MARTRKRFIAGAECPACGAADTLQLTISTDPEGNVREEQVQCVACQHTFSDKEEPQQQASSTDDTLIGLFKPE